MVASEFSGGGCMKPLVRRWRVPIATGIAAIALAGAVGRHCASQNPAGAERQVTLKARDKTFSELLSELQRLTGYSFIADGEPAGVAAIDSKDMYSYLQRKMYELTFKVEEEFAGRVTNKRARPFETRWSDLVPAQQARIVLLIVLNALRQCSEGPLRGNMPAYILEPQSVGLQYDPPRGLTLRSEIVWKVGGCTTPSVRRFVTGRRCPYRRRSRNRKCHFGAPRLTLSQESEVRHGAGLPRSVHKARD
jgi:hypothetical protein